MASKKKKKKAVEARMGRETARRYPSDSAMTLLPVRAKAKVARDGTRNKPEWGDASHSESQLQSEITDERMKSLDRTQKMHSEESRKAGAASRWGMREIKTDGVRNRQGDLGPFDRSSSVGVFSDGGDVEGAKRLIRKRYAKRRDRHQAALANKRRARRKHDPKQSKSKRSY